jgi:hypothetical protein
LDGAGFVGDGYAVFGKVVGGMEVVDRIATVVTTTRAGHADVPAKPILIKKAVPASVAADPGKKDAKGTKDGKAAKEKEPAKPAAEPKAE